MWADQCRLQYEWYDFFASYSKDHAQLLTDVQALAQKYLSHTGFLHFRSTEGFVAKQRGVVRVNCVDCLDRCAHQNQ